jgi:hypothetical protein
VDDLPSTLRCRAGAATDQQSLLPWGLANRSPNRRS